MPSSTLPGTIFAPTLVRLFLLLAAAHLSAQPPLSSTMPVYKTTTRSVIVDVVVRTPKGDPVPGLRQQDFTVLEDGKPQTIDFFEEQTLKEPPPGASQPLPAMPPHVYNNIPAAPEADSVNVLLLDSLNTPQQDFAYARNQVISYLNNVKPGTRLAIFTLGDKLNFVQGFTSDPSVLKALVEDRKKGANGGFSQSLVSRSDQAENTTAIENVDSAMTAGVGSAAAAAAISSAFASYSNFALRNRTLMTLEALDYLARYLAGVPGRKNLIWFSSTFPVVVFPHFDQRQEAEDLVVPFSDIRRTADLLTASRVAVYPVNARGVITESVIDADSAGAGNDPNGPAHLGALAPIGSYAAESADRASVISAMNQLAHDTGGKAIYNTNDLNTATLHAIDDGSQFYSLAYTPSNRNMDGKYRTVEVKINEGKYRLAYRHGYNADNTAVPVAVPDTDPLRPLLRYGLPNESQILYAVRVVPASPQPAPNTPPAGKNPKLTGPTTRYNVDFFIRWTDVRLDPTPRGTHIGKLQIELLAFDRDGKAVNWEGGTQQMSLTPDIYGAIEHSGIPAHAEIDLPNTPVHLVTGVYDWETGKVGTLQFSLAPEVAAPPAASH